MCIHIHMYSYILTELRTSERTFENKIRVFIYK